MKKFKGLLISAFTATLLLTSVSVGFDTASAKVTCKQVNAKYKYGVKKSSGTKNKVVNRTTKKVTYKYSSAKTSAKLYNKYKKLDYDKDGIACEK